jgi:hypothetical protein
MSDDYIMQIMFGAADVNSVPKRVTSHLHHWEEDVAGVEGFGMMAGNHAAGAEADIITNPSSMRGALDTLVNYGADQVGRFPRVGIFPDFVCHSHLILGRLACNGTSICFHTCGGCLSNIFYVPNHCVGSCHLQMFCKWPGHSIPAFLQIAATCSVTSRMGLSG